MTDSTEVFLPAAELDSSHFKPIREMLEDVTKRYNPAPDKTDLDELGPTLESMGIRRAAILKAGQHAVILETTGQQILRLSGDELPVFWSGGRPELPEVLPAIHTGEPVKKITYEILPKLSLDDSQSNERNRTSYRSLFSKMAGYKYSSDDALDKDLGTTRSGAVSIMDIDRVKWDLECEKNEADEPRPYRFNPETDMPWVVPATDDMPESRFEWLKGTGYITIYEHDYPAVHDQRPRGILGDEDIERLRNGELDTLRTEKPECFEGINAKNLEEFIELVKEEGWYPSQAQKIMREKGTLASVENFAERFPRGDISPFKL